MNLLKKIYQEFSDSNSFSNSPYSWLTNQIGHIAFSFIICYYTGAWFIVSMLWIYWELKHYSKSKDLKDLVEDLFFELSGVFIFLFTDIPLALSIIVLIVLFLVRVYKN